MRGLTAFITDLVGNHLAMVKSIPAPGGGNQTFVGVDLCGPRTAKVRISAGDHTAIGAMRARAGSRMLKVYYLPPTVEEAALAFWGVAGRPVAKMGGRVLEVGATCPTLRAKRAFPGIFSQPGGAEGVTVDGKGLEDIWGLQVDTAIAVGCPGPGVVPTGGRHGSVDSVVKAVITEGQSFQDYIDTLSDAIDGPDWDLRPLDTTLGEAPEGLSSGAWASLKSASAASAFYAQLHTYDRKGNDLRDLVYFGFGTAPDNLEDLEVEEAGEQTINATTTAVTQGDEDTSTSGYGIDMDSILEIGVYSSQSSISIDAGRGDPAVVAQQTADGQIGAYGYAPVFLTMTVKKDELAKFYPFHNYEHGDWVTVSGESGALLIPYMGDFVKQVPARVTRIELQEDPEGRVQQTTTVVVGDFEED